MFWICLTVLHWATVMAVLGCAQAAGCKVGRFEVIWTKTVKFKFFEYVLGRNDVRASLLYDTSQNISFLFSKFNTNARGLCQADLELTG